MSAVISEINGLTFVANNMYNDRPTNKTIFGPIDMTNEISIYNLLCAQTICTNMDLLNVCHTSVNIAKPRPAGCM